MATSRVVSGRLQDYRLEVAGSRLWLTVHALRRYVERVRPAAPDHVAARELEAVLRFAVLQRERPGWMGERPEGEQEPELYVVLDESIAFPVSNARLLTCIVRGTLSDAARVQKAAHRRKRAQERGEYGRGHREGMGFSGMRRMNEAARKRAT